MKIAKIKPEIAPEVIKALRTLRRGVTQEYRFESMADAINTLDNAGIFAAIDEATNYDIDPAPERVSKCTCPRTVAREGLLRGGHNMNCPGDPAEWGDMAYTTEEN